MGPDDNINSKKYKVTARKKTKPTFTNEEFSCLGIALPYSIMQGSQTLCHCVFHLQREEQREKSGGVGECSGLKFTKA